MKVVERRIVGSLLISVDKHLLLGYKSPGRGDKYSDCWVIPGGGVNTNETDVEALHREIMEETGFDISSYESILIDDTLRGENRTKDLVTGHAITFKMKFFDYVTNVPKCAKDILVVAQDDLTKVEWIPFERLSSYKLSQSTADLLKRHGFI
ncbi:MAG TPA: NUDIX domain-containing protein [Candidatus Chromulinivoraceae bacterium]|nr:NUDIX domain-containing protein [Candidatus Chromulinivoraceae bacterium]